MNAPIDIYARVSRLRDKDQTSTPAQIAVCRAILQDKGLPIGEVWDEPGRSAWNPKVKRPKWDTLMQRLESGAAGGVIMYDLERFTRQMADGERMVTLAEKGIAILDSEGEYDLRKPGDRKNFRNAIVAAAYYSDLLKAKVRRGKKAKAATGKIDQRRSFGFESDGTTPREDEAQVIRDHARRLLAGEVQQDLIRELNEQGPYTVNGKHWTYTTYRQVMTRPRNAGYIVHNGAIVDGVRLPGVPVLDQLTYDRLAALYASRRAGRPPSGRYLLTGLAICGQPRCGVNLEGRPIRKTRKQYFCRKCRKTYVSAQYLDDWAGDWAIKVLSDPQHADALAEQEREQAAQRAKLLAEQGGIETLLTEIAGRLGRQEISLPRHDAICKPLEQRLAEITGELAGLAAAEPPAPPPPGTRTISPADQRYIALLAEWDKGTTQDKRAMVTRALAGHRLVIGPGQAARFDPSRVSISK